MATTCSSTAGADRLRCRLPDLRPLAARRPAPGDDREQGLGERFREFAIPLPDDVPEWLFIMLSFFCDVAREQVVLFNGDRDRLVCAQAVIPSFGHDGGYCCTRS